MPLPLAAPETWDPATVEAVRRRAEAEFRTPWPVPLAHTWARFRRDGDRDAYEGVIWEREYRLSRATVVAAVTGDPAWIDEVADGVVLLCEQSSWCWPAHDQSVVPDVTAPVVDLGAAEVAAQLAWIDRVLGSSFDSRFPGVRARIRYETDRRVFVPFVTRRDWHWLGLTGPVGNWTAWIHGHLLVAARQLAPDRADLVRLAVEGLERYERALPADGAIDEGYSYWWHGAARLLDAWELLGRPPHAATVAFPHRVHLGGEWYLNHADGFARPPFDQAWHVLHRAARRAGDSDAEAHAAAHRGATVSHELHGLGRLLAALADPEWAAARPGPAPLPRESWFPSTQVLVARTAAGSADGLTLAVKGGHNDEHHNHNDVGSVVVAVGGRPVLVDPGRPTYTAQTFGPDRYAHWAMRSTWHNTPTIRGTEQAPGRVFAARDVTRADGSLTLDLAPAYPRADIRRWTRTARLDRTTGAVTVSDAWDLEPGDGVTTIHWVVAGPVTVSAGRAEIGAEAGPVVLTWAPPAPATLVERRLDDPLLRDVWGDRLTRLDIDVTALGPAGRLDLTVVRPR